MSVILESSDSQKIEIPRNRISPLSLLIREILEDSNENQNTIPIPYEYYLLNKVIEFCEYYSNNPHNFDINYINTSDINKLIPEWYCKFVDIDTEYLLKLINLSDYLNIDPLIDLLTLKVATLIKGKTPQEIRDILLIEDDTDSEDKEEFMLAHNWIKYVF